MEDWTSASQEHLLSQSFLWGLCRRVFSIYTLIHLTPEVRLQIPYPVDNNGDHIFLSTKPMVYAVNHYTKWLVQLDTLCLFIILACFSLCTSSAIMENGKYFKMKSACWGSYYTYTSFFAESLSISCCRRKYLNQVFL